jgi:hypothetical protein
MMIPAAAIMALGAIVLLCQRPPLIRPRPTDQIFRVTEWEPSLDGKYVVDDDGVFYRFDCIAIDLDRGECLYAIRKEQ